MAKSKYNLLSEEQKAAVDSVRSGANVFLTGSGGTGKTFLCEVIKEELGSKLAVTASTGIAAVNCGGSTIHSFSNLVNFHGPTDTIVDKLKGRFALRQRIEGCEHLLIDEVSMLDGRYLDVLNALFKEIKGRGTAMGGIQLIFVGDMLQLPPVCKQNAPVFPFESNLWKEADFECFNLRKIFRQSDEQTIRALRHVRVGKITDKVIRFYRKRVNATDNMPEIEPVVLESRNVDVDAYNNKRLAALDAELKEFEATAVGDEPFLGNLVKNCLAPRTLRLCKGAQVMLLKNLYVDEGLINGSVGKVVGFNNLGAPVVKFNNGLKKTISEESEWASYSKGKKVASFHQLPLRLAWATSIHKSQGLTLDKVKISLQGCFAEGQAYVALSRAKTIDGVFLDDFHPSYVKTNPKAFKFYEDMHRKQCA